MVWARVPAKTRSMARASSTTVNRSDARDWIAATDQLYDEIRKLLDAPISNGSVVVDFRPKTITEDFMGTYTVRELVLRVGEEIAVFSPKGRNIVGASGRVDLTGEMGEATLVLQPGPRWAVVAQRVPVLRLVPLEQESLLAALRSVMRP